MTSLKSKLSASAEYWFAKGLGLLPSKTVSAIGGALGRRHAQKAIRLNRKWVQRLHENFATLSGVSDPAEREQLIVEHIEHIGRVYAEYPVLHRFFEEGRFRIQNGNRLDNLDGPVIFVCAHTGHWELVAEVLRQHKILFAVLYDPIGDATKLRLALELRNRFGSVEEGHKLIPASPSAGREIVQWVSDGGNLLVFIDEEKDGLIWSPALGRQLPYQGNRALVTKLAARYQASVVPIHIFRQGEGYEAEVEEVIAPPPRGGSREEMVRFADGLSDQVETWVRSDPGQWYWLAQLKLDKEFPRH